MTNVLGIVGFRPLYMLGGGEIPLQRVQAISGPATSIFKGDNVTPAATGLWDLATAGTGNVIGSVSVGCQFVNSAGKVVREKYLPAGTTYTASAGDERCNWLYVIAPDALEEVVFEATVSEATTPIVIAQTDLNLNYNFVAGAGSTPTGNSGQYLNSTGRAVTSTLQWRVIAFKESPRNDRNAINPRVLCRVNLTMRSTGI
jgi:hypothetical protein